MADLKDSHTNATPPDVAHPDYKHSSVLEITSGVPLPHISGVRLVSKDKKRTYLDKVSFGKWFDHKQFEKVAERSKIGMSGAIPTIDAVFPVTEPLAYTNSADHKTILEYIDEVCHVLENMDFKDAKQKKHFPFSRLGRIQRIYVNEADQIVIEFKGQNEMKAGGKKSQKAMRREKEGKISAETRPKDEIILGIHPEPNERSVCFGKCLPVDHCEYITKELKCILLQTTASIRDKSTREMRPVKLDEDFLYPAVELKRSEDYPWAMDKKRLFYNKIYKINVMPILFLVYRANMWIIANHYLLCQERNDPTSWHLFADYDPLIECDPAVKWFNSKRTCTLDNFFNVMRYLCRLDKKIRILSADRTIQEYRLTPDDVFEPNSTEHV
jgi:hypothetical protein